MAPLNQAGAPEGPEGWRGGYGGSGGRGFSPPLEEAKGVKRRAGSWARRRQSSPGKRAARRPGRGRGREEKGRGKPERARGRAEGRVPQHPSEPGGEADLGVRSCHPSGGCGSARACPAFSA